MSDLADLLKEIKAKKKEIKALQKSLRKNKNDYLNAIKNMQIPIQERWKLFVEAPFELEGSFIKGSTDCELLEELCEDYSGVIELGCSVEYIEVKKILLNLLIDQEGNIKKSYLAECSDKLTEKDVWEMVEDIFQNDSFYVGL